MGNFFCNVDWLVYINVILKPEGFIVNGKVQYIGEDINDFGVIIVKNNVVFDIAPKKANEIDVEIFNFVENYKGNIVKYKEMDYDNLNNCLIG